MRVRIRNLVLAPVLGLSACRGASPTTSDVLELAQPSIDCADEPLIRRALWQEVAMRPDIWTGPKAGGAAIRLVCGSSQLGGEIDFDERPSISHAARSVSIGLALTSTPNAEVGATRRMVRTFALVAAIGRSAQPIENAWAELTRLSPAADDDAPAALWLLTWFVTRGGQESIRDSARVSRLVPWVSHSDPEIRAAAVDVWGLVGTDESVGEFLVAVQAERRVSPIRIYETLASLGGRDATDYLAVAARSETDPRAKYAAQAALRRLGIGANDESTTSDASQ
jgi:hypothetical protein